MKPLTVQRSDSHSTNKPQFSKHWIFSTSSKPNPENVFLLVVGLYDQNSQTEYFRCTIGEEASGQTIRRSSSSENDSPRGDELASEVDPEDEGATARPVVGDSGHGQIGNPRAQEMEPENRPSEVPDHGVPEPKQNGFKLKL